MDLDRSSRVADGAVSRRREVISGMRMRRHPAYVERPLLLHARKLPGPAPEGQRARRLVVGKWNRGVLAVLVIEVGPFVLVKSEAAAGARVHQQCQRRVGFLTRVLDCRS